MTNSNQIEGNLSPNYPLIIREMEIDDLAPVYHLGEKLFTSDLYPYLYRNWDEWEVVALFHTDSKYCLVAEINDQIAGFILGNITSKASWTYGYIVWLGVSNESQRRGVASKLVDKLVEVMIKDGVRFLYLDTDPENTRAVNFFTRKGFGNRREHIYLSMNLAKDEYYGKKLAEKRANSAKLKKKKRHKKKHIKKKKAPRKKKEKVD